VTEQATAAQATAAQATAAKSHSNWFSVLGMAMASICAYTATITALSYISLAMAEISGHPAWGTFPTGLMLLTSGLLTFRVSLAMQKFGRRNLFIIGALCGVIGGLLCLAAVFWRMPALLFGGAVFLGGYLSSAGYYRFAAAERVAPEFAPRAISLVLTASLIAALAAPLTTAFGNSLLDPVSFGGAMLVLSLAPLSALIPILLTPLGSSAPVTQSKISNKSLPLAEVWANPQVRLGLVAAVTAQMTMSLLMQATPLAMQGCGFAPADSAHVIQWHVIGMFGPALFAGEIVRRFGARPTILAGLGLMIVSAITAIAGISFAHFAVSMVILGIGWNLLFTAGSSLLAGLDDNSIRARAQGLNETCVNFGSALTSASAAALLTGFGWVPIAGLGLILLVPLCAVLLRPSRVPV
jgi:MFS family permease